MSRTQRTPPPGLEHIPHFHRDHEDGVIREADGCGEAWGRYRKRKAKIGQASMHRLENKKKLQEELDEESYDPQDA